MWIVIGVAVFLLLQWLFIGYRFSFGPFQALGDIRMSKLPGNAEAYSMKSAEPMADISCALIFPHRSWQKSDPAALHPPGPP